MTNILNKDENKKYYIYILLNPFKQGNFKYGTLEFNYEPYYVGRGKYRSNGRDRVYEHFHKNSEKVYKSNKYKHNLINKIKKEKKEYLFKIFQIDLSIGEANLLEVKLIDEIGRYYLKCGPLLNATDGGDGASGYKWSDERKRKFSESMMGDKNHFYSKEHSTETKIKMSCNTSFRRPEVREKMRKSKTFKNGINPRKGVDRNDLSEKSIESIKDKLGIKIVQKSMEGDVIKIWRSASDAAIEMCVGKSAIYNCLKGISNSSCGFLWEYFT